MRLCQRRTGFTVMPVDDREKPGRERGCGQQVEVHVEAVQVEQVAPQGFGRFEAGDIVGQAESFVFLEGQQPCLGVLDCVKYPIHSDFHAGFDEARVSFRRWSPILSTRHPDKGAGGQAIVSPPARFLACARGLNMVCRKGVSGDKPARIMRRQANCRDKMSAGGGEHRQAFPVLWFADHIPGVPPCPFTVAFPNILRPPVLYGKRRRRGHFDQVEVVVALKIQRGRLPGFLDPGRPPGNDARVRQAGDRVRCHR